MAADIHPVNLRRTLSADERMMVDGRRLASYLIPTPRCFLAGAAVGLASHFNLAADGGRGAAVASGPDIELIGDAGLKISFDENEPSVAVNLVAGSKDNTSFAGGLSC